MKKIDVQFTRITPKSPWGELRVRDSIHKFIKAETSENAINYVLNFLAPSYSDSVTRGINKSDQILTFYDDKNRVLEQVCDFKVIEVIEYATQYCDYAVMSKEGFNYWKKADPAFINNIKIL